MTVRYTFGGVQDRGNQGFDILGDVFLKNLYAVRIAFGQCAYGRFGMPEILSLVLFHVPLGRKRMVAVSFNLLSSLLYNVYNLYFIISLKFSLVNHFRIRPKSVIAKEQG